MEPKNSSSTIVSYKPQLDTIRAFAVVGVMTHHYLKMYEWLDFGGTGVSLFFVLSGFLITSILLEAKYTALAQGSSRLSILKNFIVRRILRIFPIYYLYIFFFFVIGDSHIQQNFQWYVSYAQNIFDLISGYSGRHGHMWSLAVEEQFYLFWPWLILFFPRRWEGRLILFIITSSFVFKLLLDFFDRPDFVHLLPGQFDYLGMGAFLAFLVANRDTSDNKFNKMLRMIDTHLHFLLVLCFTIVLAVFYVRPTGKIALFGMIYSIFAALLVYKTYKGFTGWGRFVFGNPLLTYVGKISYGIYLYHMVMPKTVHLLETHFGVILTPNPFMKWILCTTATLLIAIVSWNFIERPINNLKRYFKYVNDKHT